MSSSKLFNNVINNISLLTGAEQVSLFLFTSAKQSDITLLASDITSARIPEIEKIINASEATIRALPYSHDNNADSPLAIKTFNGSHADTYLVRIPIVSPTIEQQLREDIPTESCRRDKKLWLDKSSINQSIWIELRFKSNANATQIQQLNNLIPSNTIPADESQWLAQKLRADAHLLCEMANLSRLLQDPVSRLGGRAEFQAQLKYLFDAAKENEKPLTLMLVNPDDFGSVNQRFDQHSGDQVLLEIAIKLRNSMRSSDEVYRYGGAIYAVVLPHTGLKAATATGTKVADLMKGSYLDGALRLSFSIGVAVFDENTQDNNTTNETELLRHADHALNQAKRAGGAQVFLWDGTKADKSIDGMDRLSDIFTANIEKDYRNMLLLWDTIAIISQHGETNIIANDFVELIQSILKPDKVWLLAFEGNNFNLLSSSDPDEQRYTTAESYSPALSEQQESLLAKVKENNSAEQSILTDSEIERDNQAAYAVPLLARDQAMGCLYIQGPVSSFSFDSSDLIFLNALASQIALVLDRADLVLRWKHEKELESERLREEVAELRQVFLQNSNSSRFITHSPEVQAVLDTLNAVASTDVTVLVTGESGTGKEMLARMVHEQSQRSNKPLVIVDCAAIAHSLIESELFGYVKGAYTGADITSQGRIVQADGGTLFLDEIGELPLDVQSKLLRFVQEKEISSVGATKTRIVDVRIVAATNRDLSQEVAAGRFREDLYYRLKVVTLTPPPLRQRSKDIIPLAQHFIDNYVLQYERDRKQLTPEAEMHLLSHHWPGNVRELQNCILRAVVLSQSGNIDVNDLQLSKDETDAATHSISSQDDGTSSLITLGARAQDGSTLRDLPQPEAAIGNEQEPWLQLKNFLENQVRHTITDNDIIKYPFGQWLIEDLVKIADEASNGIARRASARLGVAETTYRRQLEKVKRSESMGLLTRKPDWTDINQILWAIINLPKDKQQKNILDAAKQLLLTIVSAHIKNDFTLGASLMGVTRLTYKRWSNEKSLDGLTNTVE